ncbi:MAG: hypothetical protein ABI441_18315 [Flavobacterium sp.]
MKNQNQNIEQFELSSHAKAGIIIGNMENHENEDHDISKSDLKWEIIRLLGVLIFKMQRV